MKLRYFLAAVCLLCFGFAVTSGYRFLAVAEQADAVRSLDVASRDLLISLLDAETGQRGYVITGDQRYLEPYYAGVTSVPNRLSQLKAAAVGTTQMPTVLAIEALSKKKIDELTYTIKLRLKSSDEARLAIDSQVGKNYMDAIRKNLDDIQLWAAYRTHHLAGLATLFARLSFVMMLISVVSGCYLTIVGRD